MKTYKVPHDILHAYFQQQEGMALREILRALERISRQLETIYMEIPSEN